MPEIEQKRKGYVHLCPTIHENNSEWTVKRLMISIKDNKEPISVYSIKRYIQSISDLIRRDPDTPIPNGRAIGAILAANPAESSDYIVLPAFSSNYIIDTYFRLTRNSSNNLTESILNLEQLDMFPH
ncbi:hypothetical protein AYI70_g790 [Smittium culicis]|uniref:Uncharacterized protein n=1 Tax=Smittium culicis TaxID=133412 RepID=A0A1R1YFD9_9FUNG|nr:hypothetical protein AYI70_g790 [Smittium culicis]